MTDENQTIQSATPKVRWALPPSRGSEHQAEGYAQRIRTALATQCYLRAVAPDARVYALGGEELRPGDEVTLDHLGGDRELLRHLIGERVVLEISPAELKARVLPTGTRFVVGAGAITSRRGILPPGVPCEASDFATEATETRKATDGKAALARLVENGMVRDLKTKRTPASADDPGPAAA